MVAFSISLPDGNILTGEHYFPEKAAAQRRSLPLIVAVHGGAYSSSYFDADDVHSVRHISQALHIPIIAINRPGYQDSSPLPDIPQDSSFIQQHGRYLHEMILPSLWNNYASSIGASSIFLFAHSIGAAIAVVATALHASPQQSTPYPLCGLAISGVGSNAETPDVPLLNKDPKDMRGKTTRFPNEQKDALMLGPRTMHDSSICQQTERLQHEIWLLELYDINVLWRDYWRRYAEKINVPVSYTLGDNDDLWHNTIGDVSDFASGFLHAPVVDARRMLSAPHCIELSLQAEAFLLRISSFALESALHLQIQRRQ